MVPTYIYDGVSLCLIVKILVFGGNLDYMLYICNGFHKFLFHCVYSLSKSI